MNTPTERAALPSTGGRCPSRGDRQGVGRMAGVTGWLGCGSGDGGCPVPGPFCCHRPCSPAASPPWRGENGRECASCWGGCQGSTAVGSHPSVSRQCCADILGSGGRAGGGGVALAMTLAPVLVLILVLALIVVLLLILVLPCPVTV